jgi:hypothetical protein
MADYDAPGVTYGSPGIFHDGFVPPQIIRSRKMSKVKIGWHDLNQDEQLNFADNVKTSLTGNPNFPSLAAQIAPLSAKIAAARALKIDLEKARTAALTATEAFNEALAGLGEVITDLGGDVEKISDGDATKIKSGGYQVRADGTATTELDRIENLSASQGDDSGEVDLHWDRDDGAKSYEIQQSVDPITANSWTHADVVSGSKATLGGLTSGAKMWFRVRSVGPKKIKGAWSDPVFKVVP